MLWPLHPAILRLAPAGIVLAIAAWLLVSSRLRNSEVKDFLHLVADLAEHPEQDDSGDRILNSREN